MISNACDALDKVRVLSLQDPNVLADDRDLRISISVDEEAKTLTIADNGVGMRPEEMGEFLGTIAHSGSRAFAEMLRERGDEAATQLIGQFGVGFYSAFLVAEKVVVRSLAAEAAGAARWTSEAKGSYTLEADAEKTGRGTEIVLHLGAEHLEFLDRFRLRELVRRYSDYVPYPIQMLKEAGSANEIRTKWEVINQAKALWTRPKSEIEEDEYKEFYRHISRDHEEPLCWTHFRLEGTQQFTGLLFVPKNPPFDLFDREQRRGVRLHVKRVFIMDDCKELLPEWLRFLRGVIDSDDLPLNVSRELLQEDRAVRTIKKAVVRKSLEMLEELAKQRAEDYDAFWSQFGVVVKEGLHFDPDHRERLAELVRFDSTAQERTSLATYVERMPEEQEAIYYLIGPDRRTVETSPHLEALRARGWEVLLMTDTVDEWAVHGLEKYADKPLVSAMHADLDLPEDEEEKAEGDDEGLGRLPERMQEVLEDTVEEVRASRRLTDSPCCLVVPKGGVHAHIERLLRAQQRGLPAQKRILEVNPSHPIVRGLKERFDRGERREEVDEWIRLLHDQALLAEGSPLPDSGAFARRMSTLMSKALGEESSSS